MLGCQGHSVLPGIWRAADVVGSQQGWQEQQRAQCHRPQSLGLHPYLPHASRVEHYGRPAQPVLHQHAPGRGSRWKRVAQHEFVTLKAGVEQVRRVGGAGAVGLAGEDPVAHRVTLAAALMNRVNGSACDMPVATQSSSRSRGDHGPDGFGATRSVIAGPIGSSGPEPASIR